MENLTLIVVALPDGTLQKREVVQPSLEKGEIVFAEDIVPTVPECRAAAYANCERAVSKWRSDHPGQYLVVRS
jgi:hypothetical protein